MTLDEAIKKAERIAEEQFNNAVYIMDKMKSDIALEKAIEYKRCAEEHRQLAEWLTDYKRLLEQEPILDKIRAEIEKAVWEDVVVSLDGTDKVRIPRLEPDDVLEIIDKYKAESELQESENRE